MIANHIHHALAQVQELRHKVLEKQRFKGYSGRARAIGGTIALLATCVMASGRYPHTTKAHFTGWGVVFVIAVLINYGALVYWFLFDPTVKRDLRRLKPVLDLIPPLFTGGVFTLLFGWNKEYEYLPGTWMALFGLANLATRHVLPRTISLVGLYYLSCGTFFLLMPGISFTNPWPMGLVFFIGEWMGGVILHYDGLPPSIIRFLQPKESLHDDET